MKLCCPNCRGQIKLSVEEIQQPRCSITCPSCNKTVDLKNNLPMKQPDKH